MKNSELGINVQKIFDSLSVHQTRSKAEQIMKIGCPLGLNLIKRKKMTGILTEVFAARSVSLPY
jgi:hypothetical protein